MSANTVTAIRAIIMALFLVGVALITPGALMVALG